MTISNGGHPGQVRSAMQSALEKNQAGIDKQSQDRRDNRDDDRNDSRSDRDDRDRDSRDRNRDSRPERGESRRGGNRTVSLSQLGRMNPTPLAMSNTAEALESFRRDFVEAMPSKDDNNMLIPSVFAIDASTSGLPYSIVLVAATKRNDESLGIGWHAFMLATSAEPLRPRDDTDRRGNRVTIVQVPGDGYDSRARDVIKEVLTQHYGVGKNLLTADAEVIHEGFPSAKDDPQAIADCVKNAFTAIKTAIDRVDPNVVELNLAHGDANTYNSIHVQHRQNHVYDRGHQPVRADVVIDLVSRDRKERNSRDSIDQLVAGTRSCRVGGYYDFLYAPAPGARNNNDFNSRRDSRSGNEEHQLYALRFITTFIDTIDFSPTTMLLAQAMVSAMGETSEIMRAFEPNLQLGEDDPRNIGFLGVEPNLQMLDRGFGEIVKTKGTDFTTGKRQSLLRTCVRPGLVHSIDIPECGASTWQYADLLAASQGITKAIDRIFDAASVLTDGHIEDLYSRNEPIIDEHVERIHGGYHTEAGNGVRMDLRDLDYMALVNYLRPDKEEDLLDIQKWGMAASTNEDTLVSQSERYEILMRYMPTAVVTQFFQRFNFDVRWSAAMVEAIARCKLSLNPTSSGRDRNERYRTTYGNIDQVLNQSGAGALYRNQRGNRDRDDGRYYDRDDRDDRGSRSRGRDDGRW